MKYLYPILFIIIYTGNYLSAQEFNYERDFYSIKLEAKDSTSNFYYPMLKKNFFENSSVQTDFEVLALLIGYTNQKTYNPSAYNQKHKEIIELVTKKKYKNALKICDEILSSNPFSYAALMEKAFILKKEKMDSASVYEDRLARIESAIFSSGDGSLARPFFILEPTDAQSWALFRERLNIEKIGSGKDGTGVYLDVIEYRENDSIKKYFFYTNHAKLRKEGRLAKEQQEWEIKHKTRIRYKMLAEEWALQNKGIDAFMLVKTEVDKKIKVDLPTGLMVNDRLVTENLLYDNSKQVFDVKVNLGKNVFKLLDPTGELIKSIIINLNGGELLEATIKVNDYIEKNNYFDISVEIIEK
ncbi:MAG: hypothetical protein C0594_08445 [Marinilabiliales bacterium]|nr:MAG: hypothetical protein C0594_08445 [Marinilabiliales bacterium]